MSSNRSTRSRSRDWSATEPVAFQTVGHGFVKGVTRCSFKLTNWLLCKASENQGHLAEKFHIQNVIHVIRLGENSKEQQAASRATNSRSKPCLITTSPSTAESTRRGLAITICSSGLRKFSGRIEGSLW